MPNMAMKVLNCVSYSYILWIMLIRFLNGKAMSSNSKLFSWVDFIVASISFCRSRVVHPASGMTAQKVRPTGSRRDGQVRPL
jgi:hypothetical protein